MTVEAWDDLVATALIGTERRRPSPPDGDGELERATKAIDWSEPERALLAAAAVVSRASAAGTIPPRLAPSDPAPEPTGRAAPPPVERIVERVLEHRELVPELLARFIDTRTALPAPMTPALLQAATADRSIRRPLADAGGARLRWLAAHNDGWRWASADPASATEAWETGTADERRTLLAEVRAEDPAAGRALIESTWDTDSPADRRSFIQTLQEGLSLDDEPLLEGALDDRRKPVRQAAAIMLTHLTGSSLRDRMADRLRPLISPGTTRRARLRIELPEAIDTSGRRDGIDDAGAPRGYGTGAWRLRQIIRGAPLAVWEERTGLAPGEILAELRGHDYATPAYDGLREATRRERDQRWALAWVELHPSNIDALAVLPAQTANVAAADAIRAQRDPAELLKMVSSADWAWDEALSAAVLDRLSRLEIPTFGVTAPVQPERANLMLYSIQAHPALTRRLHPDTAGEAIPILEALWPTPPYDSRTILTLRQAIHQEIR